MRIVLVGISEYVNFTKNVLGTENIFNLFEDLSFPSLDKMEEGKPTLSLHPVSRSFNVTRALLEEFVRVFLIVYVLDAIKV